MKKHFHIYSFTVNNIFKICVCLVVLTCAACNTGAQENKDIFFSYKRFFLNPTVVEKVPGEGKVSRDLNAFTRSFTDGIYAISAGQLKKAEKNLLNARGFWPEYFGTDFLLALVYEEKADYRTAARYYKSYLDKLKRFHSGAYGISESLIRSMGLFGIEKYEPAYKFIEKRLAGYDIDLAKVTSAATIPEFLFPLLFVLFLAGISVLFSRRIVPYFKKQNRIKNPPEGFWVCRNCETENSELIKECTECGRVRGEGA